MAKPGNTGRPVARAGAPARVRPGRRAAPGSARAALPSLLAALVLLALPAAARAQSVTATVDRQAVSLDDVVTLEVVLEGAFDATRGPEMPDFQVVGRSSGSSVSIVNGQMSQQQRIVLRLAPQRPGNLSIGAIALLQGSKVVAQSRPLSVRVVARGTPLPSAPPAAPGTPPDPAPAPGPSPEAPGTPGGEAPAAEAASPGDAVPEAYAGKPAFLLARAPTRPLYAGEPIPVEYLFYVRGDVPLAGLRLEAAPRLAGFVSEPAAVDPEKVERSRVRGQAYDVRVLWRGAVTALAPGRAVLDPMAVQLSVGDFFGRRAQRLVSDAVALDIRPVPAEGRPADWVEGTVGAFAVRAVLDRPSLRVGESAVLTVEVTGSGNLRAVKAPELPVPAGLRLTRVPAQDLDELVVDVGGVSGRRAFQYLLTPGDEGDFEIGRVDLSYFNPVSGKFERARSEPLRLSAARDRGTGPVHQAARPGGGPGDPTTSVVAPPEPRPAAAPGAPLPVPLVLAGMTLPVAFFLGAEVALRRRRMRQQHGDLLRRRKALRQARAALEALGRQGPGAAPFWAALETVIREFLAARFGLPPGLSPEEVREALLARGVSPGEARDTGAELEACAFGRFAPSAAQDRDRPATLQRVRDRLAALDRTRDAPRREGP